MLMQSTRIAALAGLALFAACGSKSIPRSYPEPEASEIIARLEARRLAATSYRAESSMDYWLGSDRVKGTVLLMGEVGSRARINALNPTGGTVAADLACDGQSFAFVDFNNDCQLTGPCSRDSVAQLLRVSMNPDELLLMAVGGTPVLVGARGEVRWDADAGHEILELISADQQQRQRIELDAREGRWDVVRSELRDAAGKVLWSLRNTDFKTITGEDGQSFRVPGKTLFKQPPQKADLMVEWKQRSINPQLEPQKFELSPPEGLPRCGERQAAR